jgi:acyl-CoA hydrolase
MKSSVRLEVVTHSLAPKRPTASAATLHQFMMPEHANPVGTVHGGLIMKMVDEAGAIAAMRHAQRPVVTIAVDSMTFKSPVHVGQLMMLHACLTYVGTTSMEVAVRVLAEDPIRGLVTHTNSAYLVYVALDDQQRPTPVPGLLLETQEERDEFESGRERQRHRTSGRV